MLEPVRDDRPPEIEDDCDDRFAFDARCQMVLVLEARTSTLMPVTYTSTGPNAECEMTITVTIQTRPPTAFTGANRHRSALHTANRQPRVSRSRPGPRHNR